MLMYARYAVQKKISSANFNDMNQNEIQEKLDQFTDRCKQVGLSITHQRIAIYTELISSTEHPSPEMIYQKVHRKYPTISLATVYKTLNTFLTLNLVKQVNTAQEIIRYDGNLEVHHHFICRKCHRVEDIPIAIIGPVKLPEKVVKEYTISDAGLVLNGICSSCQKKRMYNE